MTDEERAHARIEAALAEIGDDVSAPAGWEARVLAEVHARPPRRAWWKLAVPALATAAMVAAAVVIVPRIIRTPSSEEPAKGQASTGQVALALDIADSGAVRRGLSAADGDVVTITATGDKKHRAVWIYRGQRELVIACPGWPKDCSATDNDVTAKVKVEFGSYTIVVLGSSEPLPSATNDYDASLAAAVSAGAEFRSQPLQVQ